MGQHVPEDGCDPPHHSHACDLGAATCFDPAIPGTHPGIVLEEVQDQLSQDEPRDLAPFFGDGPQSFLRLARVATAGSQAEVIGQAAWTREAFDRTDPTGQSQAAVVADTRCGHQDLGRIDHFTLFLVTSALDDLGVHLGNLLLPDSPFLQQHVHFEAIHLGQFERFQPAAAKLGLKGLGGIVPYPIVAV